MTCRQMEHRIALHVSGDLDAGGTRLVLEHVRTCESCARLAAGLRADLEDLRTLRGEPADETALAAVRRSVLAEVESRQVRTIFPAAGILVLSNLRWAAVVVAILVVALAGSWADRRAAPGKTEPAVVTVSTPEAVDPIAAPPAREAAQPTTATRELRADVPRRQPAENPARAVAALPQPAKPEIQPSPSWIEIVNSNASGDPLTPPATLVKLTSSDPNVVLYWLVESDGG